MSAAGTRGLWLGAVALLACGCGPEIAPPTIDIVPPYVLGVDGLSPNSEAVDVGASFTVRFSEQVKREKIFWTDATTGVEYADSVVLAEEKDEATVVSAVDNPPLSSTQRAKTVPSRVTMGGDGASVVVQPAQQLLPETHYILVVSRMITDLRNNKLVEDVQTKANESHVVRFTTGTAPDHSRPTAKLQSPPAGARAVPTDTAALEVLFSEPIDPSSFSADRIGLVDTDSQQSVPPARVDLDGALARVTLLPSAGTGCSQLCTGTEYALVVSDEVRDLAGNPFDTASLVGQSFTAASCQDTSAPRIAAASVQVAAGDTTVTVSWKTDEPSTSVVQYVQGDGGQLLSQCGASRTMGCLSVTGDSARCDVDVCALPDEGAFACTHQVTLTGLTPNKQYSLRVVSADGGGRTKASDVKTTNTLPPQPKLVLNEIFATPQGLGDSDKGKFVELYNASDIDADLSPQQVGSSTKGWTLQRCVDAACTSLKPASGSWPSAWELRPRTTGGSLKLGARQFAVAGGDAFDAQLMGVPAGALLLKGSTSTLISNGLTSGTAYAYALVSPAGLVVSTYGAFLGTPSGKNGKSFERRDAAAGDVADNWSVSTAAMATAPGNFATPGLPNSVSP